MPTNEATHLDTSEDKPMSRDELREALAWKLTAAGSPIAADALMGDIDAHVASERKKAYLSGLFWVLGQLVDREPPEGGEST